jgi:hypothetical protein
MFENYLNLRRMKWIIQVVYYFQYIKMYVITKGWDYV